MDSEQDSSFKSSYPCLDFLRLLGTTLGLRWLSCVTECPLLCLGELPLTEKIQKLCSE